jgi:hypothetical protein
MSGNFMRRISVLFLVALLAGIRSGSAQISVPIRDAPFQLVSSIGMGGSSCNPAGNIDEVPFEASAVPIEDWLKQPKASQIPMEMKLSPPELRMDQQTAVYYRASINLKNPKAAQERKVVFFIGVDGATGERLTETSVRAVDVPSHVQGNFDLAVLGCVYLRPGSYSLWIAAYDESTGKHSVRREKVRVSEIKNDPLPLLESQFPPARFPDLTPEETDLNAVIPSPLFLPVSNKRALSVDIITLSPYQNGIGPLTHMALKDSSISVANFDLQTQKVVYDSRVTGTYDFTEMLQALKRHKQDQTIDLSVLLTRDDRVGYLRKVLEERMKSSDGKASVTIVLSSPIDFKRGADTSAIQLDANCECRLFYLQMFPRSSDDLEKVLGASQSRRLEVNSALEFRKALASIVRDLEAF